MFAVHLLLITTSQLLLVLLLHLAQRVEEQHWGIQHLLLLSYFTFCTALGGLFTSLPEDDQVQAGKILEVQ